MNKLNIPVFCLVTLAFLPVSAYAGAISVDLGTAGTFAILAGSAVTSTGLTTVHGNLGVTTAGGLMGFPPGMVTGGTIHQADDLVTQAQQDLAAAYNFATGETCDNILTGQDLGARTLQPGVYCFSSSARLTGTLTLDAEGDPNAVFLFQIGSTLTTANGSSVALTNGGSGDGVFWQVASSATLGVDTSFAGNILALASITINTGAGIYQGRALTRTGAVSLDSDDISMTSLPEPSTVLLLFVGGAFLFALPLQIKN